MTAHSHRATRALRRLGELDPAFAALALWCTHLDAQDPDAPPALTKGETIRYGPGFGELMLHEQVGLAAHHILHVAFRHSARATGMRLRQGQDFDLHLFNLASDAIVNQTLLLAGFALPRPCPTLTELAGEVLGEPLRAEEALGRFDAEALYIRLSAARSAGLSGRRTDRSTRSAEAAARDGTGANAYAEASGFAPDVVAAEGEDPETASADEADWRQRLSRAVAAGQAAGSGLGALAPLLAELRPAPTPWELVLRRLVTRAVTHRPRVSSHRPSRRWIAREAEARRSELPAPPFEPGAVRDDARPRIAVCVDVSASIDDGQLDRFAAEIAGIGRRTGAEVHVLAFDTEVRLHRRMAGLAWESEIKGLTIARGGGTSFRTVIPAAAALDPSIIVVFTDLDGAVGAAPGRVPVLWAVPGPPREPPFGRVMSLGR